MLYFFLSIGLESPNFFGIGEGNTERFHFVDGSQEDRDFFQEPFSFPWASNQPDDTDFDDDCVM